MCITTVQAGTPTLEVEYSWHESGQEAVLKCTQKLPSTPKSPTNEKSPQLLPVAVGFIGSDGKDLEISEVRIMELGLAQPIYCRLLF